VSLETKNEQNISGILIMGLLLGLSLGILYANATGAPVSGCISGSIFAVLSLLFLLRNVRQKHVLLIVLIFAAKYALTLYQAKYKNLPMGGEDWWNYHRNAQGIMENAGTVLGCLLESKSDLFSRLVAVLYSLFGVHTMYINLFVFGSSLIAANYVMKTMLLTNANYASSFRTMLVFLVWPIDVIYSVTYLREIPVQMLVILSLYHYICFLKQRQLQSVLFAFAAIAFACMMHSGVIGIIPVYIMFILVDRQKNMKLFSLRNIILFAGALLLLRYSPFWDALTMKLGDIDTAEDLVERTQEFLIEANTQYITKMPDTLTGIILQLPWRTALFAVVPLPWMIKDFSTAIAWVLDAIPQLWILYRLYKLNGLSKNTEQRVYYVIGVFCILAAYVVCSMGTTAYGNAIRHRAKVLPIILVLVIGLYDYLKNTKVKTV